MGMKAILAVSQHLQTPIQMTTWVEEEERERAVGLSIG
jgi:hypothetical protein